MRCPIAIVQAKAVAMLYTSYMFSSITLLISAFTVFTTQTQNTLRVTHIIVPKQKGNADSCETLNEEELFDVQDQYDLITLGWIHVCMSVRLCVEGTTCI